MSNQFKVGDKVIAKNADSVFGTILDPKMVYEIKSIDPNGYLNFGGPNNYILNGWGEYRFKKINQNFMSGQTVICIKSNRATRGRYIEVGEELNVCHVSVDSGNLHVIGLGYLDSSNFRVKDDDDNKREVALDTERTYKKGDADFKSAVSALRAGDELDFVWYSDKRGVRNVTLQKHLYGNGTLITSNPGNFVVDNGEPFASLEEFKVKKLSYRKQYDWEDAEAVYTVADTGVVYVFFKFSEDQWGIYSGPGAYAYKSKELLSYADNDPSKVIPLGSEAIEKLKKARQSK